MVFSVAMWLLGCSRWLIIGLNQVLHKDCLEQTVRRIQVTAPR